MVMGLALISTTPVIMALVQENFPENRALANGTYMCLSFVLRSAIVVAVGGIGDMFDLRNAFVVSSMVMFAGLPFILLLPKDRVRRDRQQDKEGMISPMEV
jgi:FSR family fosmidomycin resistance protein-like MFS transporter